MGGKATTAREQKKGFTVRIPHAGDWIPFLIYRIKIQIFTKQLYSEFQHNVHNMHGPNTKPRPLPLCLHNKPPTAHYFAPKNISASSSQLTNKTNKQTNKKNQNIRLSSNLFLFPLTRTELLGNPDFKTRLCTKNPASRSVYGFRAKALKTHSRVSSLNSVAKKKKEKERNILVHNL